MTWVLWIPVGFATVAFLDVARVWLQERRKTEAVRREEQRKTEDLRDEIHKRLADVHAEERRKSMAFLAEEHRKNEELMRRWFRGAS